MKPDRFRDSDGAPTLLRDVLIFAVLPIVAVVLTPPIFVATLVYGLCRARRP